MISWYGAQTKHTTITKQWHRLFGLCDCNNKIITQETGSLNNTLADTFLCNNSITHYTSILTVKQNMILIPEF